MDVLRYSAANAKTYLEGQISEKTTCVTDLNACYQLLAPNVSTLTPQYRCWKETIEPFLQKLPHCCTCWSFIEQGTGWVDGFKVCGSDQNYSQGASRVWSVPEGISCVRFQIWGAGAAPGSGGMCCSISPFGDTGAYASIIMPVSQGESYSMCSGCAPRTCAYCAYGCQRTYGFPSWITGPGLCNFCVQGGIGNMGLEMYCSGRVGACACYYGSKISPCCGYAQCGQGSFGCWSATGRGTCGNLCFRPGANYFGGSLRGAVYGIKGIFSEVCSCGNNNGSYFRHPPVYGFTAMCQCFTTGCCGRAFQACCGFLQIPGAGGFFSVATSGWTGLYGDCSGRFGMVCVSYK